MLAGMQDTLSGAPVAPSSINVEVGESMFETLGKMPNSDIRPDAEEMAERMRRMQLYRKVQLKQVVTRTYDLGDEQQREQYQMDLEHIIIGSQIHTHVLMQRPPLQFINDGGNPRYIAHLEWMEFVMQERPVPTVGAAPSVEGENDGPYQPVQGGGPHPS